MCSGATLGRFIYCNNASLFFFDAKRDPLLRAQKDLRVQSSPSQRKKLDGTVVRNLKEGAARSITTFFVQQIPQEALTSGGNGVRENPGLFCTIH